MMERVNVGFPGGQSETLLCVGVGPRKGQPAAKAGNREPSKSLSLLVSLFSH